MSHTGEGTNGIMASIVKLLRKGEIIKEFEDNIIIIRCTQVTNENVKKHVYYRAKRKNNMLCCAKRTGIDDELVQKAIQNGSR